MIDYDTLKQIAKDLRTQGLSVGTKDMLALAPGNDPFYVGAPGQRRDAEWFARVYDELGITSSSVHLRRVHYRILELSEESRRLPVPLTTKDKDTGQTITFEYYGNYERCWDWLTNAAKYARYLALVPIDTFVDNRAKESSFSFFARWPQPGEWEYNDPTPRFEVGGQWYGLDLPDLPSLSGLPLLDSLPDYRVQGYTDVQQRYHIEIWVEKSEGEDVILPLCKKYKVNFVPGVGDMSITTTHRFCERVKQSGKAARLLYISDFDPSGYNMPVAVARKLEHMVSACGFGDLDITLEPIMLTETQVLKYNLPSAPIKDSDARKAQWELAHGGAVELNAMFAKDERIPEAQRIIETAILQYYDTTLTDRAYEQRQELRDSLIDYRSDVLDSYSDEWQAIENDYTGLDDEWNETRAEFDDLIAPFKAKVEAYRERLADINRRGQELFEQVTEELAETDIDPENDYPLPEAKEVEPDRVLYYSRRDYWTQLKEYHAYKLNGDSNAGEWLDLLIE